MSTDKGVGNKTFPSRQFLFKDLSMYSTKEEAFCENCWCSDCVHMLDERSASQKLDQGTSPDENKDGLCYSGGEI